MTIRYRFEAQRKDTGYTVKVSTSHYPFASWRDAGTLSLSVEEWEALRDMIGRFTASVKLDELQEV